MHVPPEPLLLAAKRWLETLPASGGISRAQALLTTLPEYSDLTPTQYASALSWLSEVGLLPMRPTGGPIANQVLSAVFEYAAPAWIRDADELVQSPDELPIDVVSAGAALGLSLPEIYEQLVSSWGKVDTAQRERVGAAGEAALVDLLRQRGTGRVDHVSMWSDGFGYDIAFTSREASAHLEVKSTTRVGRFTAYLSRNEYRVMLRDPRWALVVVRLSADLTITGVGSVPAEWVAQNVPRDTGVFGGWESCKLRIPEEVVSAGIPKINDAIAAPLPHWSGAARPGASKGSWQV